MLMRLIALIRQIACVVPMPGRRRLLALLVPMFAVAVLAGCENPYVAKLRRDFGWTEERMVRDGWLESRQIPHEGVYCYETLGDPECFDTPKAGETHRLIGGSHPQTTP